MQLTQQSDRPAYKHASGVLTLLILLNVISQEEAGG